MEKRCQICDGPIVNGRCKFCGMPYRKDELRYHLNENRSDHYKHASARAQRAMEMEQIPLPDRKKTAVQPKNAPGNRRAAGTSMAGNNARGSTGNRAAGNRDTRSMTAGYGRTASYGTRTQKKKETDPGSRKMWATIITTVVLLGISVLPDMMEFARDKYGDNLVLQKVEEAVSIAKGNVDTEDMELRAVIDLEGCPTVKVGAESSAYYLVPGLYVLENQGGNSSVGHYKVDGTEVEEYKLHGDKAQEILELDKGDVLSMRSTDNKYNYLLLYLIEQYDE